MILENNQKDWLRELLCIIHSDGGHYTIEHGMFKSCNDAVKRIIDERRKYAESKACVWCNGYYKEENKIITKYIHENCWNAIMHEIVHNEER